MANRDIPNGFTPIGTASGADWNASCRQVVFAAGDTTAAFIGDLVKLTGTADATGKLEVVAVSTPGDSSIGVLVGLAPDFENESFNQTHRSASTAQIGIVAYGPDVLYEVQEDSVGNDIEIAEAGLNINMISTHAGSTVTGRSGQEIDSTSAATTAGHNMRLRYVADKPGNALGTHAVWVVSLNDNRDTNTTGV